MRQLRGNEHTSMATRRHGTLSLQRVWTLLQDERTESTPDQAQAKIGECKNPTNFVVFDCLGKPILKIECLRIRHIESYWSAEYQ